MDRDQLHKIAHCDRKPLALSLDIRESIAHDIGGELCERHHIRNRRNGDQWYCTGSTGSCAWDAANEHNLQVLVRLLEYNAKAYLAK